MVTNTLHPDVDPDTKAQPAATTLETVRRLFQSRKFWVLLAALASIAAALSSGAIDTWQALQAAIAALAVYSTGIAIVDAGAAAGKK